MRRNGKKGDLEGAKKNHNVSKLLRRTEWRVRVGSLRGGTERWLKRGDE